MLTNLYGGSGSNTYIIKSRDEYVVDSGGTDYGTIHVDWYKPSSSVENWTWASGVQKLPYWIDALTYDSIPKVASGTGSPHVVSYYFARQTMDFFSTADRNGFQPVSAEVEKLTRATLDYISTQFNIKFVEVAPTSTSAYTIVFGSNTQPDSAAYASVLRDSGPTALMLDKDYWAVKDPSKGAYQVFNTTLKHELGHALGLKHTFAENDAYGNPAPGPYLPKAEEESTWSLMSYTLSASQSAATYAPFDLAALDYAYGISASVRAGDSWHYLNSNSTNMIRDGSGSDTVDGTFMLDSINLNLNQGYWGYVGKKAETISSAGQITIGFGTVIENAIGGMMNDVIIGNSANNRIEGNFGNDVLTGAGGNDELRGDFGTDTAAYTGNRANFTVLRSGSSVTVTDTKGGEGKDTLTSVERIRFADATLALDIDGNAGKLYRVYQAAFDRKPDLEGMGYWIAQADGGVSFTSIANGFITSDEFARVYGQNASNETFVDKLYTNVLHRAYDKSGFDFWVAGLNAGASREQLLLDFAESPENYAQVIGSIQNGFQYTPYA